MARLSLIMAATTVTGVALAQVTFAQVDVQRLGSVHFETSCTSEAQKLFDQGMLYQHSFWYRASKKLFEDAIKADPACAIALWGVAQSLLANPFNPTPRKNLVEGLAAIEQGKSIGAKTKRENDLITAIGVYYANFESSDQRTRAQSYVKAMENVAERYPDDDETQIYYALALNIAADPSDKSYANQLKAAGILEAIAKRRPQHPGVVHYLIHTYDYPSLARQGLDAAVRYAKIAAAAPHAQHMPSHIFTRVGYWSESITSNRTAAELAKAGKEPDDQLHASDYMVYAFLQLGRDREAQQVIDEMARVAGYNPERNTAPFALAASPARYVVERGDWVGATQLEVRLSKFAYADAITHFARALGHAHLGQLETARAEAAKLVELRDRLRMANDRYWAEQVAIQEMVASAWISHAERKHDKAIRVLNMAAEAEDRTEKATVTPGPLAPARELLGSLLLEHGRAAEALAAFEATLTKEPNRLDATLGVAKSAEMTGDLEKAQQYYARAVTLTESADPVRPEIAYARQFVAKH